MKRIVSTLIGSLASLIFLSGCAVSGGHGFGGAKYERTIEKSFEAKAGELLALKSDLGSVTVRTHAGDTVTLIATLKTRAYSQEAADEALDHFDISFKDEANQISVLGEWKDRSIWRKVRMEVHYEIEVPAKYDLKIKTAGGSISVADLRGEVDLRTSGGSISAGNVKGAVTAHTSGGSIRLEESDGPADLRTSGGSITVGEVTGHLDARTSGGSIRLRGVRGNLTARTSGGSIQADLLSQISEPANLSTSGGSIRLAVDSGFKADIDAETSGGRVSCDLPVTIQGTLKKSRLNGTLNGGGPRVNLRTSGGSIYINEL